jgi:hypothetical protein
MRPSNRSTLLRHSVIAIALFWCAAGALQAEVYRWIDANGNVVFSDQAKPGAERIDVAPLSTINLPSRAPAPESPRRKADTESVSYKKVNITFPEPNATFHSGNGSFIVTTEIEPALSSAHELRLLLNGKVYATGRSGNFAMTHIDRGTHTLQVQIVERDKVIQESPEISFTIHRPSILHPEPRRSPQ